ncbi:polyphosphate polymerase domain-containing protein [Anaerovorax odorimutans]|uniref:Polyphosphate polymerase domain-containing protein n=1 Tax=Anaerovorax odorimutans TaxID=109327 RepID=A0ABT1RRT9_9FIRM|nr:polyphosphate polymerase domain-containing protein [Anaerovorax odorimutans]MCQ4637920.1 polyphosphate polymerase domain-containing protein [Anaerovorax odorimutans]
MTIQSQSGSVVLSVARREVKYLLSLPDRLYILDALDRILIPDAYGDYNGYTVRSVYFDSIANDDYTDKVSGSPEKKRIRLRIYHPNDLTAKFELKRKSYGRELKESLVVTREDAIQLLRRNYRVLLGYDSDTARYAYQLMTARLYRPVSMIEYDRRAYTHPSFNTRVTLDNNLRYCDFDYNLFSRRPNFRSAMAKDQTILEIKYDRFLFKQIQQVLANCDLTRKPPSKFGTSRDLLKEYYY